MLETLAPSIREKDHLDEIRRNFENINYILNYVFSDLEKIRLNFSKDVKNSNPNPNPDDYNDWASVYAHTDIKIDIDSDERNFWGEKERQMRDLMNERNNVPPKKLYLTDDDLPF